MTLGRRRVQGIALRSVSRFKLMVALPCEQNRYSRRCLQGCKTHSKSCRSFRKELQLLGVSSLVNCKVGTSMQSCQEAAHGKTSLPTGCSASYKYSTTTMFDQTSQPTDKCNGSIILNVLHCHPLVTVVNILVDVVQPVRNFPIEVQVVELS